MGATTTLLTRALTRKLTQGICGIGAVAVPTGAIKSITIADTTKIDTNGSDIGVNGSGWVAIAVLKGITSLVGTCVPSALTLTVSDPGYDTSGDATTVQRTITGVAQLRRQFPNGDDKMISTDGTDLTLYITLDDWIYEGTTIVSASILDTFYTDCVASDAGTKSNLSDIAYTKPVFGWINPQQERTGSTHAVEAVAFHRHATAGQQVACIKYSVNDGSTTSDEVTVSAPTLSTRQTIGNIAEVWAGTVDMSAMTQAAICTVNAKVYPWLGDSSAVLDMDSDGVSWPTSLPRTKLRVLCDRTGGYGGAYAYVQSGASGGTTSETAATAAADPYPTIVAALSGIKAHNNANNGHNDFGGGTVRLMDDGVGGDVTYSMSAAGGNTPGDCWCDIEKDPDTSAVISFTGNSTNGLPSLTRFKNLRIVSDAAQDHTIIGYNVARSLVCLDTCTVDNTNNKNIITWFAIKYLLNVTMVGTAAIKFNGLGTGTAKAQVASMIGLVSSDSTARPVTSDYDPHLCVGCNMSKFPMRFDLSAASDGDHGRIIYNNKVQDMVLQHSTAFTQNYGMAIVQNQCETLGSEAFTVLADGDLTTIDNFIDMHNTTVGERANRMYNDVAGSAVLPSGVQKRGISKYSLWDNYNTKTETHNVSGVGSVGTWAYAYSVGNVGNVSLFGAVSRGASDAPHNDNDAGVFMGHAWLPSSEYNCRRTGLGSPTQATVMGYFTSYTAAPQGSPALGGNYQPKSTSTVIKNRVPSGKSVLLKDIAGNTRKTDGTGAAGAYEAAA